jgi:hypothetical protein
MKRVEYCCLCSKSGLLHYCYECRYIYCSDCYIDFHRHDRVQIENINQAYFEMIQKEEEEEKRKKQEEMNPPSAQRPDAYCIECDKFIGWDCIVNKCQKCINK